MAARILGIALAASAMLGAAGAHAQAPTQFPETGPSWALAQIAEADGAAAAAPTGSKKKTGVTAQGQAGVVLARGNTDTTTANAKFEVTRTTRSIKDDFEIEGLYGKTGSIVTAERWATNLQHDWNIGKRTFWFTDGHYEHDLFSGFAYQANLGTGIGYQLVDAKSTKLRVQIGAGYQMLRPEQLIENSLGEVIQRIDGASQGQAVGNGKLAFEHSFNAQTQVTDSVMVVYGTLNTFLENDLALNVKLNGALSLSLGYTLRNNSNPPPGLLHTDTLTTVNLVYQMK